VQDEPITVSLASDKFQDKKDALGRFVDPLELVYRQAVDAVREIYAQDRCIHNSDGLNSYLTDRLQISQPVQLTSRR
jgi:hypothetical protein